MKLTNEEKEKVFAMYYGCDCLIGGDKDWKPLDISDADIAPGVDRNYGRPVQSKISAHVIEQYLYKTNLLLTPLSRITDDDAIGLMHVEYGGYSIGSEIVKILRSDKGRVEIQFRYKHPDPKRNNNDGYSYSGWAFNGSVIMDQTYMYLISKGYAVKLYPWNMTAIELGIAIEKPAP